MFALHTVLCPVDFSPATPRQVDIAADLCRAFGAKLIPLGDITDRADEIDKSGEIVVYCRSGKRSESAVRHLQSRGFDNIWNLRGGINGWATEIDPDMGTY